MDKIGVVIVNQCNSKELLTECIASAKACSAGTLEKKAIVVGGQYEKSELLNKGLDLIGDVKYVALLNTNEELRPDYLDKCMRVFDRYSNVMAVYTDYYKNYQSNLREFLPSFDKTKITSGYQIPTMAIFRKEVFDLCGNFDANLKAFETWDMWIRISEKFPIYHLPESLYVIKTLINQSITVNELLTEKNYILDKVMQRTNGNK